ncbi:50S ribosomal protein L3 [Candidatus Micrarchaeota archaeon CG10_big_fil_rev_8_21_14_0_10_59_7]|nr:MAG: 50S ribosomal protein L3 [Candidatus Micrarchaeota archaeon CG10_big_fil_rev_8_21_14_0_10_59_7]
MGKRGPKRGSRAFWHRGRARRIVPRMRDWGVAEKGAKGFLGYKAGMLSVTMTDDRETPTKGQEIVRACTVIEVPPAFIYSIIAFKSTPYGLKTFAEIPVQNAPKELKRRMTVSKKARLTVEQLGQQLADVVEIRLTACTQPKRIRGVGKKEPDLFEVALGGDVPAQFEYAKSVLGKELKFSDVFQEGETVDAVAVTKGKGWQGVVKRYGVSLNIRKATKSRRHGGSIGPERQGKVMYTIPRAGQMGFHRRTDEHKRLLKHGADLGTKEFKRYGFVKNDYVIVDGSVPGPAKRVVMLHKRVAKTPVKKVEVKVI